MVPSPPLATRTTSSASSLVSRPNLLQRLCQPTDDQMTSEETSILGRSIVIHTANKTRLACGNIISELDGTASRGGKATDKPSTFVTTYPTAAPFNPPQVVAPFNGTAAPSNTTIDALPFPLPNKALSLQEALFVNLTVANSTVYVNNTQAIVALPAEIPVSISVV